MGNQGNRLYLCRPHCTFMNEDRLNELRQRLNDHHKWPGMYMFKFILPSDEQKIAQLKRIFSEDVQFNARLSSNGKYTSITVREIMLNADAVFDRYLRASQIEGILSL
jgi:uncharacterized protein